MPPRLSAWCQSWGACLLSHYVWGWGLGSDCSSESLHCRWREGWSLSTDHRGVCRDRAGGVLGGYAFWWEHLPCSSHPSHPLSLPLILPLSFLFSYFSPFFLFPCGHLKLYLMPDGYWLFCRNGNYSYLASVSTPASPPCLWSPLGPALLSGSTGGSLQLAAPAD